MSTRVYLLLAMVAMLPRPSASEVVMSKEEAQKAWMTQDEYYGTQPDINDLLQAKPNCSDWIWGSCYVTQGSCGAGTRVATRSGQGCSIIALTVRCSKSCDTGFNSGAAAAASWGINELSNPVKEPMLPEPAKPNNYPEYQVDGFGNQFIADETSETDEGGDMDHCRYEKSDWSECGSDGFKKRTRHLRKNRGEDQGLQCPLTKLDSQPCGGGGGGGPMKISSGKHEEAPDCRWKKSSKQCGKCDKDKGVKTCTMNLKKGDISICGKLRTFEKPCGKKGD